MIYNIQFTQSSGLAGNFIFLFSFCYRFLNGFFFFFQIFTPCQIQLVLLLVSYCFLSLYVLTCEIKLHLHICLFAFLGPVSFLLMSL